MCIDKITDNRREFIPCHVRFLTQEDHSLKFTIYSLKKETIFLFL